MQPTQQPSELFSQRQKITTEIRRNSRLQDISRRRHMNLDLDKIEIAVSNTINQPHLSEQVKNFLNKNYAEHTIDIYIQKFKSDDLIQVHEGIINIRKFVSQQNSDYVMEERIQKLIDSNIIIKLIEYMKQSDYNRLQIESAWIITNVLAGTSYQCSSVINKGVIPVVLSLLASNDPDVVEQIVWGVGNLAGDSVENRDLLLNNNVVPKLVHVINTSTKYQTIKQAAWCLAVLTHRSPPPHAKHLKELAEPIFTFLASEKIQDLKIINNLIWAITTLTDVKYHLMEEFRSSKVLVKLVELFQHMPEDETFVGPILGIFGNIATSEDTYLDDLLKFKDIGRLIEEKFTHENRTVREQAVRFFQYVVTGAPEQIEIVYKSPTLLPNIVKCLDQQPNVQMNAIRTLSNLLITPTPQLLETYYRLQVFKKIIPFLDSSYAKLVQAALECVQIMLITGQQMWKQDSENRIKVELNRHGLTPMLQKLQSHPLKQVYNSNLRILNRFFEDE